MHCGLYESRYIENIFIHYGVNSRKQPPTFADILGGRLREVRLYSHDQAVTASQFVFTDPSLYYISKLYL